jgi:cell division protein FtsL
MSNALADLSDLAKYSLSLADGKVTIDASVLLALVVSHTSFMDLQEENADLRAELLETEQENTRLEKDIADMLEDKFEDEFS